METKTKTTLVGAVGAVTAGWLMVATPHFEGLRLTGYRDPVGIATKCYGDTSNVILGHKYTKEECDASLDKQLTAAAKGVLRCSPELRARSNQLGPAIDFAYNAGVGAWCKSGMARKFKAGDWKAGCAEFSKWVYAGGKVLPGLVKRRAAEREKCESDLW